MTEKLGKSRRSAVPKRLLSFEASIEWASWMLDFQEHLGMSRSVIIDRAVRELAEKTGFSKRPPRR